MKLAVNNMENGFPLFIEYKEIVNKAPESSAILYIERLDQDYHTIYKHLKTENCGKVIESHWEDGLRYLNNEISKKLRKKNSFVPVLIRGANNVGKSMFCKSLINKILTQTEGEPKTLLMDIDLGQPIFGVPSWISLIEFQRPILSNYEINISREEKNENDVGILVKSYFINEIVANRNEDYLSGTDFTISRSSTRENPFHGIIGELFEEWKKLYSKEKSVLIINAGGGSAEVKNIINYELNGIDYTDRNMLGENTTHKSVEILEAYKVSKGK